MPNHYQRAEGVILSEAVEAVVAKLAEAFFAATGKTLFVTSGTRTPRAQARAMYALLAAGSTLDLYANQDAAQAIRRAYQAAERDGADPEHIVDAMTAVLEEQVRQGIYLSRHMSGLAADIRSRDMNPAEQASFETIARAQAIMFIKEDTPPHYHLQL